MPIIQVMSTATRDERGERPTGYQARAAAYEAIEAVVDRELRKLDETDRHIVVDGLIRRMTERAR